MKNINTAIPGQWRYQNKHTGTVPALAHFKGGFFWTLLFVITLFGGRAVTTALAPSRFPPRPNIFFLWDVWRQTLTSFLIRIEWLDDINTKNSNKPFFSVTCLFHEHTADERVGSCPKDETWSVNKSNKNDRNCSLIERKDTYQRNRMAFHWSEFLARNVHLCTLRGKKDMTETNSKKEVRMLIFPCPKRRNNALLQNSYGTCSTNTLKTRLLSLISTDWELVRMTFWIRECTVHQIHMLEWWKS